MLRAAVGHLGLVALLAGKLDEAESLLARAVSMAEKARDVYRACHFLAHLGALRARMGKRSEALLDFAASEREIARSEQVNPNLPAVLRILRAAVEGGAKPDEERAVWSSDVRIAERVFAAAVRRRPLRVASDGRWFCVDGGAPVSLVRRKPLARFVRAMAVRVAAGEVVGLSSDELFRIGWPREIAKHGSGRHRVHVAVSELRKMGLSALVSDSAGYRLDADPHRRPDPASVWRWCTDL